jgi:hypothetical protein
MNPGAGVAAVRQQLPRPWPARVRVPGRRHAGALRQQLLPEPAPQVGRPRPRPHPLHERKVAARRDVESYVADEPAFFDDFTAAVTRGSAGSGRRPTARYRYAGIERSSLVQQFCTLLTLCT